MNPTLAEFHILLIEDSRADAKIIERARCGNPNSRIASPSSPMGVSRSITCLICVMRESPRIINPT